ncbi:MAG TPA: hypothetical protein ENK36_05045 [Desulfobacterales bacterium]|nr:hypothetical protein [Desulfobacterales bacterium]
MRRKYDIKSKRKRYAGTLFRSTDEASWAVFFDCLGIEYIYEPEWYEVETGGKTANYKPDFFLPKLIKYIEIKPNKPIKLEKTKAAGWTKHIGDIAILFNLKPPTENTENGYFFPSDYNSKPLEPHRVLWCECPRCGHIDLEEYGGITSCGCFTANEINKMYEKELDNAFSTLDYFSRTKRLLNAYKIANNHKFSKANQFKKPNLPVQRSLF